jgi:hypothetical protein
VAEFWNPTGVERVPAALGTGALIKAALALRGLPAGPPRVAVDPPTAAQLDALAPSSRTRAQAYAVLRSALSSLDV